MASSLHDVPGGHTQQVQLKSHAAATTTETTGVFEAPFKCRIRSVTVRFDAAITGADSNTTHVNVLNAGTAGSGSTELASVEYTSGTDAVKGAVVTLYEPDDPLEVAAGTLIQIQHEKVGNGLLIPTGLVTVTYEGA